MRQLRCSLPVESRVHIGLVRLRCILTKPPAGGDAGATAEMQLTSREPRAYRFSSSEVYPN